MADGVNPVVDTNLGGGLNPSAAIGMMSEIAEMRNRQNANLLFQQQMQARRQLGEDMAVWSAQGLSPEERVNKAASQPYGPFVTPELSNYRAMNLAGVDIQKAQAETAEVHQRMVNAGMGPLAGALAATGGDPTKFDNAFKVATAAYPPELQADLAKAYPAIKQSLIGGTSELSPEAAKAKVIENTRNLGSAFGLPLDKVYAMTGGIAPTAMDVTGPQGQVNKAIVSGGGTEGTNATVIGTGPTLAQAESQKIGGQQAAGLPPTPTKLLGPQGQEVPAILSGGGSATGPATASPILMGGPPSAKPQGTSASPGAPAPMPEPTKGPPNEASVVMGPSLASAEFMKKTGELGGAIQEEVNDNAKSLPTMAKRVDLMVQELEKFQTGGFADIREGLAELAQGLRNAGVGGITDETIQKISNGSLPAQQVFESLVSRAGVQTLKADAQGTGRVMRSEVDRYLEMMGATQDPRALATIMSNLRYTLLVGYDQGQKFTQFKQALARKDPSVEGLDVSDFPSVYNKDFDEAKLVTPKGISLGEVSPRGFKGGTGEPTVGAKRPPIESFFK